MQSMQKNDDNHTFAMRKVIHFKSVCMWIMDSGAFKYMTLYKVVFDRYEVIAPPNMHLGDKNIIKIIGMGSIIVEIIIKNNIDRIHIEDVLHISKLHANLLSMSKLVLKGLKM